MKELPAISNSHLDYKPLEEHDCSAASLESSDLSISPEMTGNQHTNVDEMQTSTFSFAESNSSNDEMDSNYGENDPDYSPSNSCDDIESDEEINDPVEEKNGLFLKVSWINFFYSAMNVETLSQVKQNIVKEACSQLKLHAYVDIQKHGNHNP